MAEVLTYVLEALRDEGGGAGAHAAALSALCDTLYFAGDDVLRLFPVAYLSRRLPALIAGAEAGDVPILAARAVAEACELDPLWCRTFAEHGAVEALRDRLLAVDNIDLAEECLRALHTISVECPEECLRLGVAAAALTFFDFFSTNKQKMALKIVGNLLYAYEERYLAMAVDAAPALCHLLQSTDNTVLESAVGCLALLAAGAGGDADHVDRLCTPNVVEPAMKLLQNDGWKSLNDNTFSGILGFLKDIASVSEKAVKSILDLGACDLLKLMITYYSASHSNSDKFQMVVELLCELMRSLTTTKIMDQDAYVNELSSTVPHIVQIAKYGARLSKTVQCVVVVGNIIELSKPAFLMELHNTVNLSRFISCLLARRNRRVLFYILKVCKTLLEKDYEFFSEAFAREGVSKAIEVIQVREKDQNSSRHKLTSNNTQEDCSGLDLETSSKDEDWIPGNHSILNLTEQIKKSLKGNNKSPSRFGCFVKSVKDIFARLNSHDMTLPAKKMVLCQDLSDISSRLLTDELPGMSTFEFVEGGSTKHLAGYLSCGATFNANIKNGQDLAKQLKEVQSRLQKFTHLAFSVSNQSSVKPLGILVEKLLDALNICYDSFPIILSDDNEQYTRESTTIPLRCSGTEESDLLHIQFVRSITERELCDYDGFLPVHFSLKPDAIEASLWPHICESASKRSSQQREQSLSRRSVGSVHGDRHRPSRLVFSYKGTKLRPSATVLESIIHLNNEGESDILISPSFWDEEHKITYKRRSKSKKISSWSYYHSQLSAVHEKLEQSWIKDPFFCTTFIGKLPGDFDESDPSYNFLLILKVLEGLNRFSYQLSMDEQICKFAEGCLRDLDDLKVSISPIPQSQFTSSLLTNKLELQMQESLFKDGLIPSWCVYLVEFCPFLLSFDARWKYFCLTLHRSFMTNEPSAPQDESSSSYEESRIPAEGAPTAQKTKKHIVYRVKRGRILKSAVSMMTKHGSSTKTIEVEFEGEIATGRGPTFEFYTTVSHEFQRVGLGMWRGDNARKVERQTASVHATFGLFPQPWSSVGTSSRGIKFSGVVQKFKLLGRILARSVLDGRILDIPLSKAFYKIMLGQDLDIYDIPSFDPELGKTLLEFQALVKRKKFLETFSARTSNQSSADLSYKNVRLEALCLDFTLPGNSEYELFLGGSEKMVTLDNLEEYVSLVVDATLKSGIHRQIEAFMSGINEIFDVTTLKTFTEEEMERILCGEHDSWALMKLEDHVKFEHGYVANSPQVINFLEILREFEREEQRAFIQFTTGAPRLPLGGLASLDPKLTVVRKECDGHTDNELPSVNTCRHFIKLPPYSTKEIMRKKIMYAITECVGSFQMS